MRKAVSTEAQFFFVFLMLSKSNNKDCVLLLRYHHTSWTFTQTSTTE